MKKLISILVAFAMMAMLAVTAAFAEDAATYDPDEAMLTKYLQKGTGVTDPEATYNFTITPVTAGAPAAVNTSIVLEDEDANGDMYGFLPVADIFEGVTWPSTGVYEYTVTEAAPTDYDETANPNDTLTIDSAAEYTLRVYIKSANGTNYIDGVTVADDEDAKVDPTDPEEVADDGEGNGFSFTNTYQNNLVDPTNGVLTVEKAVDGEYADTAYPWSFELAYALPEANQGTVSYRVNNGNVQTATGSPIEVNLKAGDKLVITAMPQGTTWNVTENLSAATVQNKDSYTAAADKYNPATLPTGGQDLTTTEQILSAADGIVVTNTFDDEAITPTGILVNNLPYIALALVAIGGLVAYVVVRRRNADEA